MADDTSERDVETQDDAIESEQTDDTATSGDGNEGAGDESATDTDKGADASKEDKAKSDDTTGDDDDKEPPVRRGDASRFIIQRQQRKIAKLSGKQGSGKSGDDAGEGDDDDLAPEDTELIDRAIEKRLKPLAEKLEMDEDKSALDQFFADAKNASFKPYEKKIRAWSVHPSRRNLPIRTIAYEVAGDDLMRMGAAKGKEADTKAKKDQAGGGSDRQEPRGADAVWGMSSKDFEAQQEAVRRRVR